MMANDRQRLNIWLGINKSFDYQAFKAACQTAGCEPQNALEFAQKAGMITCAMIEYPEMPVHEAYLVFIKENQAIFTPPVQPMQQSRGLGDTIAKITHATGLDKLSELYTQVTGQPCGCQSRQEALNKLLPYNIKEDV